MINYILNILKQFWERKTKMNNAKYIYEELEKLFPDARCELNYNNSFELLVDVVLSAQTTDKAVNRVNIELFKKYPDAFKMSDADEKDIAEIIKSIGLYKNKAHNLKKLSQQLVENYSGNVPEKFDDLISLAGVGRKTANVVMAQLYNYPAFAVDTHVDRVSKRLNIADKNDSVIIVEKKLCSFFPKYLWHRLHHLLIFFGRYKCHSKNPQCDDCPFKNICSFTKEKTAE